MFCKVLVRHRAVSLLGRKLAAGFPSPADDYLEDDIDLVAYLIERPAATFVMRVAGDSMSGAGILNGDLVLVDRSLEPRPGHVVVAVQGSEMTVKRLCRARDGGFVLQAAHPAYPLIELEEHAEVWGVVVGCVRRLPR